MNTSKTFTTHASKNFQLYFPFLKWIVYINREYPVNIIEESLAVT